MDCEPASGSTDDWSSFENDPLFIVHVISCVILVLFGGIMSGLQQGLMHVSQTEIELILRRPKGNFDRLSGTLLKFLNKRRHLTLVTLLVANAIAMEALPIFLDNLVPRVFAILISVSLVVLFGEVIPQALCLRWPVEFSKIFSALVCFLLVVLSPIVFPIAWSLDYIIGESHQKQLTRAGLWELVRSVHPETDLNSTNDDHLSQLEPEIVVSNGEKYSSSNHLHHSRKDSNSSSASKPHHQTHNVPESSSIEDDNILSNEDQRIIRGALDLHSKSIEDVITPIYNVFTLDVEDVLDDKLISKILAAGHSRIPVTKNHDKSNIVGILLVRQLSRLSGESRARLGDMHLHPVFVVHKNLSLFTVLKLFRSGHSHMAIVISAENNDMSSSLSSNSIPERIPASAIVTGSFASNQPLTTDNSRHILTKFSSTVETQGKAIGIATLDDILETFLGKITDETDRVRDANRKFDKKIQEMSELKAQLIGTLEKESTPLLKPSNRPIVKMNQLPYGSI